MNFIEKILLGLAAGWAFSAGYITHDHSFGVPIIVICIIGLIKNFKES